VATRSDVDDVLPGTPTNQVDAPSAQNQATDWTQPNPQAVKERKPNSSWPMRRGDGLA
jgi:hypothetical protein